MESREGEDGAWPKQRTLPSLGFPISCPWNITEQSLRGKSLPGWTEPPSHRSLSLEKYQLGALASCVQHSLPRFPTKPVV